MNSSVPVSRLLRRFVKSVWCYTSTPSHRYEQVMPGTGGQLLVNLHGQTLQHWAQPGEPLRSTGAVAMQGVLTKPVLIDTEQKRQICGVLFEPGGQTAFTKDRASRYTDTIIDASEIWGHKAHALHAELLAEKCAADRCEIIEQFLIAQLQVRHTEDDRLRTLVTALRDGEPVTALQKRLGISQRQLHELFDRRVGIRPKLFSRLERFSATLAQTANSAPSSAPDYDLGYSDQAHRTREFRQFTGTPPTAHSGVAHEVNHAHVEADEMFNTGQS